MDSLRDFDHDRTYADDAAAEAVAAPPPPAIGSDERRMHVRAYNHWVSLLHGQPYPSIADLDPAKIADFGDHSVLLDFTRELENPAISYLGRSLREECALADDITHIRQVPPRSLLSRLTDHCLQIIANRAPIGFEAEFVNARGYNTLYRGILMPFSSTGAAIDFIYGVINWKEVADKETQTAITEQLADAVASAPRKPTAADGWADGPGAGTDRPARREAADAGLTDRLLLAQQTAAAVRAAETRTRAALYRALERAHDFAAAADAAPKALESLLAEHNITLQLRAPMTPIVKLVFGADHDKARLTEYAAVLTHARRAGIGHGALADYLDGYPGGIKALVAAERRERRGVVEPRTSPIERAPIGVVTLDPAPAEGLVVLLARSDGAGRLEVLAALDDARLVAAAVRRAG